MVQDLYYFRRVLNLKKTLLGGKILPHLSSLADGDVSPPWSYSSWYISILLLYFLLLKIKPYRFCCFNWICHTDKGALNPCHDVCWCFKSIILCLLLLNENLFLNHHNETLIWWILFKKLYILVSFVLHQMWVSQFHVKNKLS